MNASTTCGLLTDQVCKTAEELGVLGKKNGFWSKQAYALLVIRFLQKLQVLPTAAVADIGRSKNAQTTAADPDPDGMVMTTLRAVP